MALKDLFSGKSSSKGSEEQDMPLSLPAEGQSNSGGLARLFSKEKPPRVDLGEREKKVFEEESAAITSRIEKHKATEHGIGRLFKHPVRVITENPLKTLFVTIPVALAFFILGTAYLIRDYGLGVLFSSTGIDDLAVFAILIVSVPLAFLDFRESWRRRHIEEALPNFYRDLAGMNDSGMTLPNAVHLVAQSDYSTLTPYVRRLDNEMSWNTTFIDAIQRFRVRLATPLTDRSIDLIAKASKAGGDVSEVLRAAAKDSYEYITLQTERRNNMLIYVVIVFISFLVFVFVVYILVTTFLSVMANAGSASGASSAGAQFGGSIDLPLYTRIFTHAALIQGFFSGLVAGQMGEGRVVAGLKYSIVMLLIAWIMFRFFV
jgi:archaeal flagellar protein FlaJ